MRINGGKILGLVHRPTGQKFALLYEDNCYGVDAIEGDRGYIGKHMANIFNLHSKMKLSEFSLEIIQPGVEK